MKPKPSLEERAARQGRSPAAIAHIDERRRRVYEDRKLRQVCVDCEEPLEDDDSHLCKACADLASKRKAIYRLTPHGAKVRKKNQSDFRQRRIDAGLCWVCATPREQWGPLTRQQQSRATRSGMPPTKCPACAEENRLYQKRRRDMKAQGIVPLDAATRKRLRQQRLDAIRNELYGADAAYVPIDEKLETPRVRMLRAMLRFDWVSTRELFEVLSVAEYEHDDRLEYDRYTQALSRLRKREDLIEQRGRPNAYEYRLTPAGRALASTPLR